jgi:Tfp pilus assembly protein PilN
VNNDLLTEPAENLETAGLPIFNDPMDVVPPRVNLLPPEILEQRFVRRLAFGLLGAVLVCGAAVGGVYAHTGQGEAAARSDLESARATQTTLQQQQRSLMPAQEAQTQVLAAQKALSAAMGSDVLWSRYLDELRLKLPDGVRFSSVALTPTNGTAPATASTSTPNSSSASGGTSGTVPGTIATLTISGKARSQLEVASLLQQLATIRAFTGVYLTNTQGDATSGVISYTVTAGVTPEALSKRYSSEGK